MRAWYAPKRRSWATFRWLADFDKTVTSRTEQWRPTGRGPRRALKTAAEWLRDALGYECRDPALLEAALTHRSAGGAHNERLEFLGDAVLNCVVAKLVFREFAAADEGDLSRFRASLVSGEALAVDRRRDRSRRAAAARLGRIEVRRLPAQIDPGRRARGAVRRDLPRRRLRGGRAA